VREGEHILARTNPLLDYDTGGIARRGDRLEEVISIRKRSELQRHGEGGEGSNDPYSRKGGAQGRMANIFEDVRGRHAKGLRHTQRKEKKCPTGGRSKEDAGQAAR